MESVKQTPGTFYGVGVGPGDPELLTRKAVGVLERCPVLATPRTRTGSSVALEIVRGAVELKGKTLLPLDFPMSREEGELRAAHRAAAETVRPHLEAGRDVAMAVLGDVSLYSTFCYVMEILRGEGFPCAMVPGVPSFCAAAALLGRSLTRPDAPLHILPGGWEGAEGALDLPGTKVLMKSGRQYPRLLEELDRRGMLEGAAMVENCGLPGQRVFPTLGDRPESTGYFTTILLP